MSVNKKKIWIIAIVLSFPVVFIGILVYSKFSNKIGKKCKQTQNHLTPSKKKSSEDLGFFSKPLKNKNSTEFKKSSTSEFKKSSSNGILLEFRPSYFYPISKGIREAFHNGGINYQITGQFPVYCGKNAWLQGMNVWAGVDYFSRDGRTSALNNKTRLRIVPLTLGLKFFFPAIGSVAPVNFYIGSGMKYFFVYNYTDSDYVKRNIYAHGMGGVVETGFTTTVIEHLVFDVFASYSFKTFQAPSLSKYPAVEPTSMNISGVNIGGGIGYKF